MKSAAGQIRGSEGHIDGNPAVVVDIDLVDKTEVIDIDRNFGVIYGTEHLDDALFDFKGMRHLWGNLMGVINGGENGRRLCFLRVWRFGNGHCGV